MIVRVKRHENNFVMIDNRPLCDVRLSWKARGLLAYLLSRPNNWKVNSNHLSSISTDGPLAVQTGLKELQQAGYAKLDTGGKGGGRSWTIYEHPALSENAVFALSGGSETAVLRTSQNPNFGFSGSTKDGSVTRTETETKGGGTPSGVKVRPAVEVAEAYGASIGLPKGEVAAWFDHFDANGWKVSGRAAMKDWRAALRTWQRRYVKWNRPALPAGVPRGQRPPAPGVSTFLHPNGFDPAAAQARMEKRLARKLKEGTYSPATPDEKG